MTGKRELRIAVGILRLLRRWTQERLAREVGMTRCTVVRYEQGDRTPRTLTRRSLHEAAGLSAASWERLLAFIADLLREIEDNEERGFVAPKPHQDDVSATDEMLAVLAPWIRQALAAFPPIEPRPSE
ncbi:MAG TPA: helix-turn-helix transcriptional regulator [Thermoanaerobaculia bacterium]|nr:helix-turn-helix transcriptional regulator [Thermoanaerobaculia bacterium]